MSAGLLWYKHEPEAFNDGSAELSLAERGAYITIINRMYIDGGPLADRATYVARLIGCAEKEWAPIRRRLLKLDKLQAVIIEAKPYLTNRRAQDEIEAHWALIQKRSRGGLASAKARGFKSLKLVEN